MSVFEHQYHGTGIRSARDARHCDKDIFKDSWIFPKVFQWLQEQGDISNDDMYRIFNCGVGMTLIVNQSIKDQAIENIKSQGYEAFHLGNVHGRDSGNSVTYL